MMLPWHLYGRRLEKEHTPGTHVARTRYLPLEVEVPPELVAWQAATTPLMWGSALDPDQRPRGVDRR